MHGNAGAFTQNYATIRTHLHCGNRTDHRRGGRKGRLRLFSENALCV